MILHKVGTYPHLEDKAYLEQRAEKYSKRLCIALNCERSTGKFWGLCTRHRTILNTYGLDPDDYEQMRVSQGYMCAICEKPESEASRSRLVVDHDHDTGQVRGLLCQQCNTGIGMLRDNHNLTIKASNYLRTN